MRVGSASSDACKDRGSEWSLIVALAGVTSETGEEAAQTVIP
jgi:hypothetical protein